MFDGNEKSLLFLALMAFGALSLASQSAAPDDGGPVELDVSTLPAMPLGALGNDAPLQVDVPEQTLALTEAFDATLLYAYVLEGEVVSRRRFFGDHINEISPLDLGVVWGDLDIDGFEFNPGNRVLWSQSADGTALPEDWEIHVTNNHLLPVSNAVWAELMAVEVGQQVRIEGYLVEITGDHISPWRSSTRRNDNTIVGGCEIILVTGIETLDAGAQDQYPEPA